MTRERRIEAGATDHSRPDWGTAGARVRWLVDHRFRGNRSAFASAVGVSHTAVNNVVTAIREPGRKLLTAISLALHVEPSWLEDGEGQPFAEAAHLAAHGLPASRVVLPGPPLEHQELLSENRVEFGEDLFAPSRYWLILAPDQPLLREPSRGFLRGDMLLMETNRAKFPRVEKLGEHLCVVRLGRKVVTHELASVTYFDEEGIEDGPTCLVAEPFKGHPAHEPLVREEVYRHYPGGEVEYRRREFRVRASGGRRAAVEAPPGPRVIQYADIVAVWMRIIHRM
jgi:hypothetical protein